MKQILLLILFFSLTFSITAQTKYFIYFKDKGISEATGLAKSSQLYKSAEERLSEKSRERRAKVLGRENIVTYKDIPIRQSYKENIEKLGIKIRRSLNWLNAVSCYLTDDELRLVRDLEYVERVEPVRALSSKASKSENVGSGSSINNSTTSLDYGNSYMQMNLSEVPAVHDLGIAGEGVIIGFIDSGFNWKHHASISELNVLYEYDFVYDDDDTGDDGKDSSSVQNVHGTQTLAVACGYEPEFIVGPAYKADVMLGKTEYLVDELNSEEDDFAAAVEQMENRGVDIITTSLGYLIFDSDQFSYTHDDMDGKTSISTIAFETAAQLGVLTITSSGNEGEYSTSRPYGGITAPADGFLTIAVGNVTSSNIVTSLSSRGPTADGRIKPELCALGTSVYSVGRDSATFRWVDGTSYSAPIVAGIAGQLYSAFPHLTNRQARQILMESGDNVEMPNNDRGWGLLSARKAVTYPNLEDIGTGFRIHKIFIDTLGVNSETIRINYSINGDAFNQNEMVFDGNYKYTFDLPALSNQDLLEFYFTFTNNEGFPIREPESNYYRSTYGELHVNLLTDEEKITEIPTDYSLSQNYPNPFNGETHIEFYAPKHDKVNLVIYNSLGEKVTELYKGEVESGKHRFSWKGESSVGVPAASGVYFYVLYTPSQIFSGKMIYLK